MPACCCIKANSTSGFGCSISGFVKMFAFMWVGTQELDQALDLDVVWRLIDGQERVAQEKPLLDCYHATRKWDWVSWAEWCVASELTRRTSRLRDTSQQIDQNHLGIFLSVEGRLCVDTDKVLAPALAPLLDDDTDLRRHLRQDFTVESEFHRTLRCGERRHGAGRSVEARVVSTRK
jgi:hypothetical protein